MGAAQARLCTQRPEWLSDLPEVAQPVSGWPAFRLGLYNSKAWTLSPPLLSLGRRGPAFSDSHPLGGTAPHCKVEQNDCYSLLLSIRT